MKKILVVILLLCVIKTNAQINLVKNGGFEQYSNCPAMLDEVKFANFWNGIDTIWSPGDSSMYDPPCLPDYINKCSASFHTSEPSSVFFYQYPHNGYGMMQMVMYYDNYYGGSFYEQDYLQGRLSSNLVAGQSYCVTFYTVMGNLSGYKVNNIGAYLDDGMIDTTTTCSYLHGEYTPQIVDTSLISDTLSWVKIQGSFIANGTEKYITLGVFSDTFHTTHIRFGLYHISVYLIDDVSVIASNSQADAGVDKGITIGDSVYIGIDSNGAGMPCYWYIAGNPTPIDSGGQILVAPTITTTYVVVMDLCGTITTDTVVVNVWALGESVVRGAGAGVLVYPNPATSLLTIAGAAGCEVVVYDMVGRLVYSGMAKDNKYVIDVGGIAKGIYFVEVVDGLTGERVVKRVCVN